MDETFAVQTTDTKNTPIDTVTPITITKAVEETTTLEELERVLVDCQKNADMWNQRAIEQQARIDAAKKQIGYVEPARPFEEVIT